MTRLEAGQTKVRLELSDIQDVIGVALAQLDSRLQGRTLEIEMPPQLPLIPLDFGLMVQVLTNLLDNALKYSPSDTPLTIRAELTEPHLVVKVADCGPGIPETELERIFAKFYRVPPAQDVGGTGLGLSISKGIVEAHHGQIWAANRAEGGALFTLALPLTQSN
jgi:two-component system sensor histidine kinase KdpD